MPTSKRLRFEILRRDNHTCRYCGATAPDATLTVDHVVPVTLGGTDEPTNLVTACNDCNAGKSSVSPDTPMVEDVAQDALRWAGAMEQASALAEAEIQTRDNCRQQFAERWQLWEGELIGNKYYPLPEDWPASIDQITTAGLPMVELIDAVDIAMRNKKVYYNGKWSYFCGICWKKLTALQNVARQLLAAEDAE